MKKIYLLAILALAAAPVMAQSMDHSMHTPEMEHAAPSTTAYQKAMTVMHKDMAIEYTGNADKDFVLGMIPHHQGAVDMAKTELKYGTDPEIRKMAAAVIKAQEAEIKFMKEWLKKHKSP